MIKIFERYLKHFVMNNILMYIPIIFVGNNTSVNFLIYLKVVRGLLSRHE